MSKKELILVDATLTGMIKNSVFHAKLQNGHNVVAYYKHKADEERRLWVAGDTVKIEMSPFDMSLGRIVQAEGKEI